MVNGKSGWAFDQAAAEVRLKEFFATERASLTRFGSTVNQTFEAFVFAAVLHLYKSNGWRLDFNHPKGDDGKSVGLRLKFSTRGRPNRYSFVRATRNAEGHKEIIQIRHQLRVKTRRCWTYRANVVLDVAIIADANLDHFGTDDAVDNSQLLSFGEAKHMSAFAELIAGFLGMVFEMLPERLKRVRVKKHKSDGHPAPFLYVSGFLNGTALGLQQSVDRRLFDVDIYAHNQPLKPSLF